MKWELFLHQEVRHTMAIFWKYAISSTALCDAGYVAGDLSFRFTTAASAHEVCSTAWVNVLSNDSNDLGVPISATWADISKTVEIRSNAECIVVIEKEGK